MSVNKPSTTEEEYFAREEAERRQREALEQARHMEEAERKRLKDLHYMKCPKCGMDLQTTLFRGVQIDKCYHCHGMWLDDSEIEQLAGHEEFNVFQSVARIFKRAPKP